MSEEFNMVRFSEEMDILFGMMDKAGDDCLEEAKVCYNFVKQEKGKEELAEFAFEMEVLWAWLHHFIKGNADKSKVGFAFGTLMRKIDKRIFEERRVESKAQLCSLIEPILKRACEKFMDEAMAEILKELT